MSKTALKLQANIANYHIFKDLVKAIESKCKFNHSVTKLKIREKNKSDYSQLQ